MAEGLPLQADPGARRSQAAPLLHDLCFLKPKARQPLPSNPPRYAAGSTTGLQKPRQLPWLAEGRRALLMGRSRFWGLFLNARAQCHGAGLGGTHLERRQQLAAPLPDGFVVLGAVLFVPVAWLEYPTQNRELTPAPRAQGNERVPRGSWWGQQAGTRCGCDFWGPAMPRACSVLLPERPWCQAGERAVPACLLPCHR